MSDGKSREDFLMKCWGEVEGWEVGFGLTAMW